MGEDKDPDVLTFGCRLNVYESEVMKAHAKRAGLENAVIVNTCAVTGEAERQARQAIRRLHRERPEAKIIVTGCGAQINPESFASIPGVDQVIGNDLKLKPETWGLKDAPRIQVNDILSVRETAGHLLEGFEGHTRAFVQVQNGCDHRCTFCVIPYGRGNSRSVGMGEVIAQVLRLVEGGYREVVISGVDVTSYGKDLVGEPSLGYLLAKILENVPDLPRLRLSSLDPAEIDGELWSLIENEPRLMPHLHLSVQAGDDMILKRMKRRHLRQDVLDLCQRARSLRPDVVFGADLIAGFPTETEEMFKNTCRLVQECDLTFLHVFPYSPRPQTPAARMPEVSAAVRKERAFRLREIGENQVKKFLNSRVGTVQEVLVEGEGRGHTPHFAPVKVEGGQGQQGEIIHVRIKGVQDGTLTGERDPL